MVWSCWLLFLVQVTLRCLSRGLWSVCWEEWQSNVCVCVQVLLSAPLWLPWFVFPRAEGKGGAGGTGEPCCDSDVLVQLCLWQRCYLSRGKVLSPQKFESAFWLGAWNIVINHFEIKKGTYFNSVLVINTSWGKLMKSLLQLDFVFDWMD